MKTLTLIRGLPGSGKTSLADELIDAYTRGIEADSYFYDDYGNYVFDEISCVHAHEWCQHRTCEMLKDGYNVVVSNTFTTLREMKEYYLMAKELGVSIKRHHLPRPVWQFAQCATRNTRQNGKAFLPW